MSGKKLSWMYGRYKGRMRLLFHKTALLRDCEGDNRAVLAQFDDLTLPKLYNHRWRKYRKSDFDITTYEV